MYIENHVARIYNGNRVVSIEHYSLKSENYEFGVVSFKRIPFFFLAIARGINRNAVHPLPFA